MASSVSHGLIWRQRSGGEWPPEVRLFGAYLLSGPLSNRIGCFHFDETAAAHQTGLSIERVEAILAGLEQEGFARYDRSCGWIWLPEALAQRPFSDSEEVRRTLPELAAVPRHASFHAALIQAFRASADRPGAAPTSEVGWLGGLIGDGRAADLARRLSRASDAARRRLPGLPGINESQLQPIAQATINSLDYIKRWRAFFLDIINTPALRGLGMATVIGAIVFVVFPGIDLGVARWFFDPPRSFSLGDTWIGRFFDTFVHYGMEWLLPVIIGVFVFGMIRGRPFRGFTAKRFLYVSLSIALGAGLLTNVILKDSWGRARPSQIVEFGGAKQFSPPFMRSTQCAKNCSFVSGDASLAASFLSFAVIADRWRRRWWIGISSFTAIVGLMRMARGSHFLSDVVFAVIFTLMIVLALERLILEDRWRGWPRWRSAGKSGGADSGPAVEQSSNAPI